MHSISWQFVYMQFHLKYPKILFKWICISQNNVFLCIYMYFRVRERIWFSLNMSIISKFLYIQSNVNSFLITFQSLCNIQNIISWWRNRPFTESTPMQYVVIIFEGIIFASAGDSYGAGTRVSKSGTWAVALSGRRLRHLAYLVIYIPK